MSSENFRHKSTFIGKRDKSFSHKLFGIEINANENRANHAMCALHSRNLHNPWNPYLKSTNYTQSMESTLEIHT